MLNFEALNETKGQYAIESNTPAFYNVEPFYNHFYAIFLHKIILLHFGIISI